MVGLVLDGGGTYAQRRTEQNGVDLAALAAANDLIVNQGSADWVGTARSVTKQNGYEHGVGGVVVDVTCKNCPGQAVDASASGVQVTVSITAKHQNAFAGVVGMPTWDVTATATSKTGWPDTGTAPGPFIVSKKAFNAQGKAISCRDKDHECTLSHPTEDTPKEADEFAWTDFSYDTPCHDTGNVDDQDLQDYMDSSATFEVTLAFGCYIAQHNNGTMNNIVARLEALAPITFPVPIVDESGNYVGLGIVRPDQRPRKRAQRDAHRLLRDRQLPEPAARRPLTGVRHVDLRRDVHPEADQLTTRVSGSRCPAGRLPDEVRVDRTDAIQQRHLLTNGVRGGLGRGDGRRRNLGRGRGDAGTADHDEQGDHDPQEAGGAGRGKRARGPA